MLRTVFVFIIMVFFPFSALAGRNIFTVTPIAASVTVTNGATSTAQYTVTNESGRSLTIDSVFTGQKTSNFFSSSVSTSNSNCEGATLASNGTCNLTIDITGNAAGSASIQPGVCAFRGQLCSQLVPSTIITVVPQDTFNCASNSTLKQCRVFVTQNSYYGNFNVNSGDVDVSSCQSNDITGLNRANCICEVEAVSENYQHPGHWRALLSTTGDNGVSAKDNIGYSTAYSYISLSNNNAIIVNSGTNLFNLGGGELQNPISQENFQMWTGSNASGEFFDSNCENWTSEDAFIHGIFGQSNAVDDSWIDKNASTGCRLPLVQARIYCFEDPS